MIPFLQGKSKGKSISDMESDGHVHCAGHFGQGAAGLQHNLV
jgi:hypothetical protein